MKAVSALALFATATALLATGCAAPDDATAPGARSEKYYRTGSNIPVKDQPPPASMSQEEKDRAAEAMRRGSLPKPPTN